LLTGPAVQAAVAAVVSEYLLHVVAGLTVADGLHELVGRAAWGAPFPFRHRVLAAVVGSERLGEIPLIAVEQLAEIAGSETDVGGRIEERGLLDGSCGDPRCRADQ